MAYGNVLGQAMAAMHPPNVGTPPHPPQPLGQPPAGAKPGAPPPPQKPKTLQEVLTDLLSNTSTKLDGHELMDLIRAAATNVQHGVQNAGNAVQPRLDKMLNPILGGALGGLSQPTTLPPNNL